MARITWNQPGDKRFESGVSRGVLFSPSGEGGSFVGVPWNGLTGVVVKNGATVEGVFFEGRKMRDEVAPGDFAATLSAIMYPDEWAWCEGFGQVRRGVNIGNQQPQMFALSWRTEVTDDLSNGHYKLHAAWNLTAVPSDKSFSSIGSDPSLTPFSWELSAAPEELDGFRPSAYLVLDTRSTDPWLIEFLEEMMYGNETTDPVLPALPWAVAYLKEWARFKITLNEDETWTGTEARPIFITDLGDDEFLITKVVATYLDDDTFVISDTIDDIDITRLVIRDNLDGTWSGTADDPNTFFSTGEEGEVEIRNVDLDLSGPEMFRISSQN